MNSSFFNQNLICDCIILEHQSFSDHYPVLFKWNTQVKTETNSKLIRDTSFLHHRDKVDEYNILLNHELTKALKSTYCCGSRAFDEFHKVFVSITDRFAPLKHIHPKRSFLPKWFDNNLKDLRTHRKLMHKKWKKDKSNLTLLNKFEDIRMRLEKSIKKAKKKRIRRNSKIVSETQDKHSIF